MCVSCALRYRGDMCLYANIFLNQSLPTRHHTPRGRGQLLRGPRPLILSPRAALVDGRFRRRRFDLAHRVLGVYICGLRSISAKSSHSHQDTLANRRSDTDSSQPPATPFTAFINQPQLHTRFHITCTWYGSVRTSVPAGWTIPSAATQPEGQRRTRRAQHSSHPDEGREARRSTSSTPLAGRMLYVERPRVIIWSGTA